jgi:hypothetical protein
MPGQSAMKGMFQPEADRSTTFTTSKPYRSDQGGRTERPPFFVVTHARVRSVFISDRSQKPPGLHEAVQEG